jgi:glycosyltransferase involved in cell wall biosynthesis
MLSNLKSRSRLSLDDDSLELEGVGEQWTLAIPVRNEEQNLRELLPILVDQRYRPKELLVLNDQSEDRSSEVIDNFASRYPWIRSVEGEAIGPEWRGKVWALHQLLGRVSTPYVVFMDADVRPRDPQSFASLWAFARRAGFWDDAQNPGFLSAFPRMEGSVSAQLLMDQVPLHLHYFMPFFRKYFDVPGAVAGCGQLMLMRVDELRGIGGMARVRHSTHDGLKLARLYQGAGKKVFTLDAVDVFSVKMYRNFSEAFKGFTRNSYEADSSLPVALGLSALLFWGFVLPYVLWPILLLNPFWAASFVFYLYGQKKLAHEMKWSTSSLMLMPLKGLASVGVHVWGAYRSLVGVETVWRGRKIK